MVRLLRLAVSSSSCKRKVCTFFSSLRATGATEPYRLEHLRQNCDLVPGVLKSYFDALQEIHQFPHSQFRHHGRQIDLHFQTLLPY